MHEPTITCSRPWVRYDGSQTRLSISAEALDKNIVLIDPLGHFVQLEAGPGIHSWSMAGRAAGLYVVRAVVDETLLTQRFVVGN